MPEQRWYQRYAVATAVLVAALVRCAWALFDVPDYWGDAYHNWIVERLTLENGFVFTDYKGRELVWLPLFRYLAAGVMGATGLDGLLPGRLVSLIAGLAAVGLIARAALRWTGRPLLGLLAGLFLALNPWHIAYSWMNMPEALGTLWVALAFAAVAEVVRSERTAGDIRSSGRAGRGLRTGHGWGVTVALFIAGTFGALTRNDVTSVLALTGGILLITRRWRASLALFGGLLAGLTVWSTWTGVVTGDPLWWLARRAAGSTDDAGFWTLRGSRPDAGLFHLLAAWAQACTVALAAAVIAIPMLRRPEFRKACQRVLPGVPLAVGGVYLAIVGWMFGRFFSWPDPRYLVMAIVPLTLATILLIAALPAVRARKVAGGLVVLSVVGTAAQLPTFPLRALAHERDRIAGRALGELEERDEVPSGPIWIDAPVAIHAAGVDLDRIRSSDQITGWGGTEEAARDAAIRSVRQEGIHLVYWDEVPYSRVHRIWPEMAEGVPFERDGLRFEPVFRSDTVSRPEEPDWRRDVRERMQVKYSPVLLWRVEF